MSMIPKLPNPTTINFIESMKRRWVASIALPLFCICTTLSSISAVSQIHRPKSSDTFTTGVDKHSLLNLPVIDVTTLDRLRAADSVSAKEQSRSNRYSLGDVFHPLFDAHTHRTAFGIRYVTHLDQTPLPIEKSDLIATGTITSVATHVTSDKASLYSTFSFKIDQILKSNQNVQPFQIVVERLGGVARFPGDHEVLLGEDGMGLPEPNGKYVLFLIHHNDTDSFEIIAGYAIIGSSISSLDRIGDIFDGQDISVLKQKILANIH